MGRGSEKNCEDINGLETIKLYNKKFGRAGIIPTQGQKVKEQNSNNPQIHAFGCQGTGLIPL